MSLPFRTRLRLMGRATGGGAGSPGGTSGQIQVNDGAGGFAGLASTGTGNAVRALGATLTNPVVGTQSPGDNSTKAASTAYVDTALAGVVQVLEGEVATFADLPAAAAGNTGHSYLVRQSTGVLFVNRKKAGIYTSDGAAWTLDGDATEAYFQDTLAWSNITSKPDAASQAEMEAGSEAAIRLMSPLRVWQAITAKLATISYLVSGGALGTPSSGTLTNCTFPTLNQNTTGTAGGLSATLAVASGGTGATTVLGAQQALNPLTINTQTASYTLVLTDAAKQVNMNVAGANTLTIPKNSSVAFPVGTQITCRQIGAGLTTVSPVDGDVTLRSRGSAFNSAGQYARWVLSKEDTDTWYMDGDIAT